MKIKLIELLGKENTRLNKKVKKELDAYLKGIPVNSANYQYAVMVMIVAAANDSNFHSQAKKFPSLFPKAKSHKSQGAEFDSLIKDRGIEIAKWAKWDLNTIIDAFAFFTNMNIGGGFGNKLKTLKVAVEESVNEDNSDTYFRSFASAVEYARTSTEKRGFEIDEDDWQTQIALGGKYNRGRPSIGKTHTFGISLSKNKKPQRKSLSISVFGMASGNFELTHYIN